ncbi:MAG: patatin-like phospholipase family protein [Acidimicrobiaceae bacterium]|nr:patatin-like phospholipase family protein [Acidimicrobiaceae bacterium]
MDSGGPTPEPHPEPLSEQATEPATGEEHDDEHADGHDGEHVSVGLALSAGGAAADAWHAGVVNALHDMVGWDARSADLILGTSAGSIVGLCLRAGIAPADLYAARLGAPLSDEGRALFDRVTTPYSEDRRERDWTDLRPQSPTLVAAALWPPWQTRPLHALTGLLPAGARASDALRQRMAELHPEPWPQAPFWATAVRLSDGRRVVFGRDDLPATAAQAVQASCAVPARFEPVAVAGQRYIDGGLHSYTNADLLGPPAFDLVVVSSAMSGAADWPKVAGAVSQALRKAGAAAAAGLGDSRSGRGDGSHDGSPEGARQRAWWAQSLDLAWDDARSVRAARRQWVDDKLRSELDGLRRLGTTVLVAEPDADTVELADMGSNAENPGDDRPAATAPRGRDRGPAWRAALAEAADRTVRGLLAEHRNRRASELLRRAAG